MEDRDKIPAVSEAILSHPYVQHLHSVIERLVKRANSLDFEVSELKAAIADLKKVPKKPKLKPSALDEEKQDKPKSTGKRAGSQKRKKKKDLPIDETKKLKASNVPKDWVLVGYKPYVVQDMIIKRNNIKYEREIWASQDGKEQKVADLPAEIIGRSFGPEIRRYIISQYNESHVTQPIIHQHLNNLGIDISTGSINFILNEDKMNQVFEAELMDVVEAGMRASKELRVDDTGARHQGKNGFCTCVHSDLFSYFSSSRTKSRVNFLRILQVKHQDYQLNEVALAYFKAQGLGPKYMTVLACDKGQVLKDEAALKQYLNNLNFTAKYAVRTITEGLMLGALIEHGFDKQKIIHSDGAKQFHLFNHALCWKHAERPLVKLHFHNPIQEKQWNEKMTAYWQLYQDLKSYKKQKACVQNEQKVELANRFDELCKPVHNFAALNSFLEELSHKKEEMLMVLKYPQTSLHNNSTEGQIREYAKRRKISGSTRSDKGRRARDVFTSLKKTCKKLEVNFWEYLLDRIKGKYTIPPLDILLQRKANMLLC